MSQIFTASADTRLRAVALILAILIPMSVVIVGGYAQSSYVTLVGWPKEQPIPFSHKHYTGELGIDCRYCHTGAETNARAGLPSTHTCMTCHSQIWTGAETLAPLRASLADNKPVEWQRVARVPDYVYFDHSVHLTKGVPCVECHGRVDQMPLMSRAKPFQMQWCLDCHRDPASRLKPIEEITRMDWSSWEKEAGAPENNPELAVMAHGIESEKLTQCDTCHR